MSLIFPVFFWRHPLPASWLLNKAVFLKISKIKDLRCYYHLKSYIRCRTIILICFWRIPCVDPMVFKAFAIEFFICEHPMPDLRPHRTCSEWYNADIKVERRGNKTISSFLHSVLLLQGCVAPHSSAWLTLKSVSQADGSGAGQTLDWFLMLVCSSGERKVLSDNY